MDPILINLGFALTGKICELALPSLLAARKEEKEAEAIRQSLADSVNRGFKRFANKYRNLSNSLFDETFLENNVAPEFSKLLTRTGNPEAVFIEEKYREQLTTSPPSNLSQAIGDFLYFIEDEMKKEAVLQPIIDNRQIEAVHGKLFGFDEDWKAIGRATEEAISGVRLDINSQLALILQRDFEKAVAQVEAGKSIVLLGPSGSGKSALAVRLGKYLERVGNLIWLTPQILNKSSLIEVEKYLGLTHSFEEIFSSTQDEKITIVVDAMERLSIDGADIAGRLLQVAAQRIGADKLRLILISQPDGWQSLAAQLVRAGIPLNKYSAVQVEGPTEEDVQLVLKKIPGLLPIAFRQEVLGALRNMKLLDLVATQASLTPIEKQTSWTGLTQVVDWIWDKWTGTTQNRHARGELLKNLGQMEAESFAQGIPKSQLDSTEQEILASLEDQSRLIEVYREKVFFSHDSVSDWARYRSLLGDEDSLAIHLRKLAIYPRWNLAIRLTGQFLLDSGDDEATEWSDILSQVSDGTPKGDTAADLLLDAVFLSTNAYAHLKKAWPVLIANEAKFLRRLLKRFLHVATVPDSIVYVLGKDDPELQSRLASTMRQPVWTYWWPVLNWLNEKHLELINLVPRELGETCRIWLLKTRHPEEDKKDFPWRREMAKITIALACELQAQREEGGYPKDAEKVSYEALLMAGWDFPDEVAQLSFELAKRRPLSETIIKRIEEAARASAKRQAELEEDPEYQERIKNFPLTGSIFPLGELLPPWPDGPFKRPDDEFQQAALTPTGLAPFMKLRPEVAMEIILALCINPPRHEFDHDNLSSSEWCELQSTYDGHSAMYTEGPFWFFLHINPEHALDTIISLVNFATERFCEYMKGHGDRDLYDTILPLSSGNINYMGDHRVYGFFRSETFNGKYLSSALMALEKWFYDLMEEGKAVDKWIKKILTEGRSIALIGVLAEVGKKHQELFEGPLLPLFGAWNIYQLDHQLMVGNRTPGLFLMGWARQGEHAYNQALDWHLLEHRKVGLQEIAQLKFWNSQPVKEFFHDMYEKWTTDDEIREKTKYVAERFNPENFTLHKREDDSAIEIHFNWPEEMREKNTAALERSQDGMTLISFPARCRQILDGEEKLAEESLQAFWEQIQHIDSIPEQDIEVERASQRADAICGGIAVLFVHHRIWIEDNPEKEKWCIEYFFNTLSNPPSPAQLDLENSVSNWGWDIFAGETAIQLLVEMPDNPVIRAAVARGVVAYHESAALFTLFRGYKLRDQLGAEFMKLLNVALLWATLRHLRPMDNQEKERKRWVRWTHKLIKWYANDQIPESIYSLPRLAAAGKRLFNLRQTKLKRENSPDYRFVPDNWNHGIHEGILQKAFGWLAEAEPGDPRFPAGLLEQLCQELVHFSVGTAQPKDYEANSYHNSEIPRDFDHWVFELVARFTGLSNDQAEASKFWKPIFEPGPALHRWPEFFLMSWFSTGYEAAGNPENFSVHWIAMIDFVQNHNAWPQEGRKSADAKETFEELLGMKYSMARIEDPSFKKIMETLLPRYKTWKETYLWRSLQGFCRLLSKPSAKPLRIPGVNWVHELLVRDEKKTWIRDHEYDSIYTMLRTVWAEHNSELKGDSELKDKFLDLVTWLVQRQYAGALEFQDEISRAN